MYDPAPAEIRSLLQRLQSPTGEEVRGVLRAADSDADPARAGAGGRGG